MSKNHSTHDASDQEITPWADNFIPVIPVDYLEHTTDQPFCWDDGCPCREDQDAINELNQQFQDGLVSAEDVECIYQGRTVGGAGR